MKNQSIKLTVIAAVLSGMTFTAAAAPATTVALDLTAVVTTASCNVTLKTGATTMAWPALTPLDFATTADSSVGVQDPKEVTLGVGACAGNNVGTNGIQLTAVQGQTVGTNLLAADLWGDDDTTGVGFLISTSHDSGTTWTPLKSSDPEIVIAPTTPGTAAAVTNIPDVGVRVDPASYQNQALIQGGNVHAVVTLAAVYQ